MGVRRSVGIETRVDREAKVHCGHYFRASLSTCPLLYYFSVFKGAAAAPLTPLQFKGSRAAQRLHILYGYPNTLIVRLRRSVGTDKANHTFLIIGQSPHALMVTRADTVLLSLRFPVQVMTKQFLV